MSQSRPTLARITIQSECFTFCQRRIEGVNLSRRPVYDQDKKKSALDSTRIGQSRLSTHGWLALYDLRTR